MKLKAVATSCSVSALVNQAVKVALIEDAEDLAAFDERDNEPLIHFDDMVSRLKSHGQL